MSDTPETQEAVERWRQGKINIFDEMARLERERNEVREALDAVIGWAPQAPDYFNYKTKARWDDDMRKALKVLEATK